MPSAADPPPPAEAARLRANVRKLQLLGASHMFLVVMPVIVPFYRAHGLDLRDVYLLQSIFAVATLVLEVPSGYAADLIWRKRSLVVGAIFFGASFSVLLAARGFAGFAVFELLAAVGVAFFSGSHVALLYVSLRGEEAARGSRAVGRLVFAAQLGETGAAVLGGLLAGVSLRLPLTVNAVTAWLPLAIALTLHEPRGERMSASRHGENVRAVANAMLGRGRLLRLVVVNGMLFGTVTLLAVWAYQPWWAEQGVDVRHFGWLWAAQNLVVALAARGAHRVEGALGFAPVAALVGLLPLAGFFGMGWGGALLGIACGLAFPLGRGLNAVVLRDAMNHRVPEPMRATANSVVALGTRLAFAGAGPLLGLAMDRLGTAVALRWAGLATAALALAICAPLVRAARVEAIR